MIKINLLKAYASVEGDFVEFDDAKQIQKDFLKIFFIFLIGPLGLYAYQEYNLSLLEEKRAALSSELNGLMEFNQRKEAIAAEIKKFEEDKIRLNHQIQFLERISRERLYPVELVSSLKTVIPEGVWINSLTTAGDKLEFKGGGDTERAISEFETKLAATPVLKNVKLQSVDVVPSEIKADLKLRSFTLTAEYVTGAVEAKNE